MSLRFNAPQLSRTGWSSLAVLLLPTLIVNLDATVLTVALPTIARTLSANNEGLQWAMDAYTLALAGGLLPCGTIADRLGHRRTLIVGLAVFAAASTGGAYAGSIEMLIGARGVMGLGAALLMPSTLSILSRLYAEPTERTVAFSAWSGTAGAGLAVGPVLAGILLQHLPWGAVLLINVPLALMALVGALTVIPAQPGDDGRRVDVLGALTWSTALGLLLTGTIASGDSPTLGHDAMAPFGLGVLMLVGFLLWEHRDADPLFPVQLFENRAFTAAVLALTLANAGLAGTLFVLTQYFQGVAGFAPLETGLRVLPAPVSLIAGSVISPRLTRHLGRRGTIAVGLATIATGLGSLASLGVASPYRSALPGLVALGSGLGAVMPATTGTVMDALPPRRAGAGSATNATFIQAGSAMASRSSGLSWQAPTREHCAPSQL